MRRQKDGQGARPPDGEDGAKNENGRSVRTSGSDERASAAIAATGSRVVRARPGERAATKTETYQEDNHK